MVYFFTSNAVDPPATIYMGKDKFENEDLIKHAWEEDVWFHMDKHSSAHVYLRLPEGMEWTEIPQALLDDLAQLTKQNSIEGNKKNNLTVIYTPSANLKKTGDMETGQVAFHKNKMVKKVKIDTKINEIVNRLNKTKVESYPDLEADKIKHLKTKRKMQRQIDLQQNKSEMDMIEAKRKQKQEGGYNAVMKEEYMFSNKGLDTTKSARELEEDFM